MLNVKDPLGSISFPSSPMALETVKVAKIVATASQTLSSAK